MKSILKHLNDAKEWINVLASIATIISLFTAFYLFKAELNQRRIEMNDDKIAQLIALHTELKEIVWTIDRYCGLKDQELGMIYHQYLPIEITETIIKQGWLMSYDIGPQILKIYQTILRINRELAVENSPDYVQTSPNDWQQRKINAMKGHQTNFLELRTKILKLDEGLIAIHNDLQKFKISTQEKQQSQLDNLRQ